MTSPFMDAYVRLLIKTCHKRGVHAMGGMAAQIPIKDSPAANEAALKKVRDDKLREVKAGHDGTWVAHPDLVKVAMEVFNAYMPQVQITLIECLFLGLFGLMPRLSLGQPALRDSRGR